MAYTTNDRSHAAPYPAYTYSRSPNSNNFNSSNIDGSLSPSTNLGLRKRDGVAIIISLLLLRLAFTPPSASDGGISSSFAAGGDSSIRASMELAFYSPFQSTPPNLLNKGDSKKIRSKKREKTARPVPLDIDGDGIVESLVVPVFLNKNDIAKEQELEMQLIKANKLKKEHSTIVGEKGWGGTANEGSWGLRVLTLKLMHHRQQQQQLDGGGGGTIAGPFAPRTLFLSPLVPDSTKNTNDGKDEHNASSSSPNIYPIKLLSVHIPIQRTHLGEEEKSRQRHKKLNEGGSSGGYGKNKEIPRKDDPNFASYDHTRHYFCGRDWHHAANSCHKHCPDGISSSCADGETCFADTPCDVHLPDVESSNSNDSDKNNDESTTMALTARGTLPGIATVWSDGSVSLHAITADVPKSSWESDSTQHRPKRARQKQKKPELELRQLWRVYPLVGSSGNENSDNARDKHDGRGGDTVIFDELGITYESGVIFDDNKVGNHGAFLIGGRYTLTSRDGNQNPERVSFHALNALDGSPLWELKGQNNGKKTKDAKQDFQIPIIHTTSSARRRSHLPTADTLDPDLDNENAFIEGDDVMTSEECLTHFRTSVLNIESGAMPHEFWNDGEYGSISVGRFDRTRKSGGKRGRQSGKKGQHLLQNSLVGGSHHKAGARSKERISKRVAGSAGIALNTKSKGWQSDLISRAVPRRLLNQQRYNAKHPRMGKPNVVLFHGRDGLAVVSLKNGRPVCHISLTDHALYADLDQDGKLDTVQVVTSPEEFSASTGVQSLIQKITGEKKDHISQPDAPVICHALVTSGLPPQEELFTAPLCLGGPSMSHRPQSGLSAAAPLLVEGSMGFGNDVVFAMNNGVIVRYDSNGREIWRKKGGLKDGTPYWSRSDTAFLGRIQFGSVKESHSSVSASSHRNQHRPGSPLRPILLSGEEGAALISPASGRVLSSVTFPQHVTAQPLLGDLNGDGTDDLLVVSADGLWGYRVVVDSGISGFFRIVIVTLLIGIAIAALVHKTSHQSGRHKRSMDA
mmetsp:Transcript_7078/g.14642  ORF Transcript_7078/g.14642 Transcript_7078/m.14642 type:complete len:1026 (+) Transcript_7078:95-3172(+)